MIRLNNHFFEVEKSYLFTEINNRLKVYQAAHPQASLIRLGIGDVTLPLSAVVVDALKKASDEMGSKESFHGYGPEQGYDFLREAIAREDFVKRGLDIAADEVFVSDGAKSDTGNFLDILGEGINVLVADPVYPVYVDTNIMRGNSVKRLPCNAESDFLPWPGEESADLIYLCSPNNPTGQVMTRDCLEAWVSYARRHEALILFDAAYEAFIQGDYPHSIYEIDGAKSCAVEIRSFSKLAGFTGLRCGYTVIPKALRVKDDRGECHALSDFWLRRQTTKFNGVPYVVQRAAEAVYSPEGSAACAEQINYYLENARILKEGVTSLGLTVFGGENAPYVWVKTPQGESSWAFFDFLLNEANLVTTPGSGFGASGEGFIRLSAFGAREDCLLAVERLKKVLV